MFKKQTIFNMFSKKFLSVQKTWDFLIIKPCYLNETYFIPYRLDIVDVSFTGKTYKWLLKTNLWRLTFNRAHPTFVFFNKNLLKKKITKNKVKFFCLNSVSKNTLIKLLYSVRGYNIFTQRGLKIKGLLTFKKRGKISAYR